MPHYQGRNTRIGIKEEKTADINGTNSNSNSSTVNANKDTAICSPTFIELPSVWNQAYVPVVDVVSLNFQIHDTVFQVRKKNHRRRNVPVEVSTENLIDIKKGE
eukprot:13635314-Ditylum_brightwellii.AAC.1